MQCSANKCIKENLPLLFISTSCKTGLGSQATFESLTLDVGEITVVVATLYHTFKEGIYYPQIHLIIVS